MDVCCARVSDESLDMLGIYPHEFAHRSLYDFILPEHADRLARIHRCLLDNVNRHEKRMLPPTQRTTSECFSSTSPNMLLNIANGSLTLKEPLGFKTSNGSQLILDSRFYLGGGLGSDLFVSSSLEHLYIVCLATLEGTPSSHTSILHQPLPPFPPITTTVTASSFSSSTTSPIQHQQHQTIIIESPPTVPSTPTPAIGYRPYPSIFNTTTTTPTLNSTTTTAPSPITSLLEHTSVSPAVAALFDTTTTVSTTPTTTTTASTITSSDSSTRLEYMIPSQQTPSPFYPPTSPSCNILNNRGIDNSIIMQDQPVSSSPSDHHHHDESSMRSSASPSTTSTSQVLNSSITSSFSSSSLPITPIISSHTSMAKEHDDTSRNSRSIKTPRVKLPRPEDCLFGSTEEDDRQRRRNSKGHLEWNHPREMYLRKTTSSRLLSAQANSIMGDWFPYQSPSSAMVAAVRSATSHPSSSSSLNPVATHHRIPSINSRIPSHQRPFVQRR
ncbi:hypothetical protein BDC45DRAFT_250114 [Circinella umbellata]|nr:hypothetical protein BDC45DRAFT_250114 [Circinella umbellata]